VKAFTVFHNEKKICTAGVGLAGVISVAVNWNGNAKDIDEFDMHVGGIDSSTGDFVNWSVPTIGVGDEIIIRLAEVEKPDRAARRRTEKQVLATRHRRSNKERIAGQDGVHRNEGKTSRNTGHGRAGRSKTARHTKLRK